MSSILIFLLLLLPLFSFFWEITSVITALNRSPSPCVSRIRLYPTARGYCAAINHSRAHKRIHHPPQSHSRYLFSIDATEGDARGRTKASGLFRAFLHALAYEISFSTGLPPFDRLHLNILPFFFTFSPTFLSLLFSILRGASKFSVHFSV